MLEKKYLPNKIYLPSCNFCNGLLNINIDSLRFSIEYECDLNKEHRSKRNIFFKTFEKFYLKEKKINNKSELDKCHICNSTYFCKCCNNYNENSIRCSKHNKDFNFYCLNCKTNLCIICIKEYNIHEDHEIKHFFDIMPSSHTIDKLKKTLNEKK